jgi:hypothetical protein
MALPPEASASKDPRTGDVHGLRRFQLTISSPVHHLMGRPYAAQESEFVSRAPWRSAARAPRTSEGATDLRIVPADLRL